VLTAATLYFDTGEDAQLKAMQILKHFYAFNANAIRVFLLLIESFYAIDLVMILRNPFADSAARTPKWLAAATLAALILATSTRFISDESISQIVLLIPRFVFFIVYVPAIIYCLLRLNQPGLSKKFRKDFMMRQLFYCGVMFTI